MTKRVEVRGVIVPSVYDDEWFGSYIDRGIITPESRFRAALAGAGNDVELYINSPGGSVFSAYEMANAIQQARANGATVTVTIGAVAASAASALALMAADKFRVYANTKLMFHGATVESWGGKQAHEDTAGLLGKINADMMASLTGRYGISPDTVAEWFAEGREGWLTAEEAEAAGMVSEIIGADAMPPRIAPADITALGEHGLAIAAIADRLEPETDDDGRSADDEDDTDDSQAAASDSVVDDGNDDAGVLDGDPDPLRDAYDAGYHAGTEEAAARVRTAVLAEVAENIQAADAAHGEDLERIAALEAELDGARGECARLADALDDAHAKLKSLTAGARLDAAEAEAGGDFWALVDGLVDEGYSRDKAIAKVRTDNPAAFAAMTARANRP